MTRRSNRAPAITGADLSAAGFGPTGDPGPEILFKAYNSPDGVALYLAYAQQDERREPGAPRGLFTFRALFRPGGMPVWVEPQFAPETGLDEAEAWLEDFYERNVCMPVEA